jgi:hypothetical protein
LIQIKATALPGLFCVEHGVTLALEVVELPAFERAPEHPAGQEYDRDGERNEKEEAFHGGTSGVRTAARRSEFNATMTELAAMPIAASHGPIQPSAAAGSASAL